MNIDFRNCSSSKNILVKVLGVLTILCIIVIIILSILYGIERNKTKDQQTDDDNNNELCLTPYCIKAANYLLGSIDETVDPCENFYQFACGTWLKSPNIADDDVYTTFGELGTELETNIINLLLSIPPNGTNELNALINVRRLYDSCMDEEAIDIEGITPFMSLINTQFGGWPILQDSTWNNSTFDLARLLIKMNEYGTSIIYTVGTTINEKNSSTYSIHLGQSDLGLDQRTLYESENEFTIAYKKFIHHFAMALTNLTLPIDNDVTAIFEFEKSIAQYHWTRPEQIAQLNQSIYTTIGKLSETINSSFDFTDYIRRAYLLGDVTLLDTDTVVLNNLKYLRDVSSIINQYSSRTVQNYVVWRFLMQQIDNMPKQFRDIKKQFNKVLHGIFVETLRKSTCASNVNSAMGFAISKLYIKKHFDENARNQSLEMIDNIRKEFIEMLHQSTWMDSISKNTAIDKALGIYSNVGYPDYLDSDNVTKLEKDYADYNLTSSYAQNSLIILRAVGRKNFRLLREPVDRKAWSIFTPISIEAYYSAPYNYILFPAAILQTPLYNKDAPKYLNYGGIGSIIGHEITHGFDNIGREYDKNGNRIVWWTNETIIAFEKRKQCIIEQYNNYTVPQINLQVNGEQTQSENIADNGGLKEAFFAYQKWTRANKKMDKRLPGLDKYSPEQMFFINYGHVWCSKFPNQLLANLVLTNEHAPPQFRVLGSTSNFAEFDRVFACKPGQGNSRVNKCSVW